jgi:L-ascorbate metabolism protein UlaG (beta-lactamase superfamily)
LKKKMILVLFLFLALAGLLVLFLSGKKFGHLPTGARLVRIERSPHYQSGRFKNLIPTPTRTEGVTNFRLFWDYLFGRHERLRPAGPVLSQKTNLMALSLAENVLVWFGHSSCFIQAEGQRWLIDPVFSPSASPFFFAIRAFAGSNCYRAGDLPEIDYLLLSHDHWDHLDYPTIMRLKFKVKSIICGLGVGAHLERWGFRPEQIIETDWNETTELGGGVRVHTQTARHFSGRGLHFNRTLWVSYVIETSRRRLYFGGDSGYGPHFMEIGARFGPFDLTILENGQYDANWKDIHMSPEEVLLAAADLRAVRLLPVHSGKFCISNHPWDEPLKRISTLSREEGIYLVTPRIGEQVNLDDIGQKWSAWWEEVQ